MKLKFDNREYQTDAINAVVDLFEGQELKSSTFTIPTTDLVYGNTGFANSKISPNIMLKNINKVQAKYGIIPSERFERDVNIEMETGTGKTYVYLNTICSLYNRYDMKKFIILVPSKAIMEGVNKSIQILEDHLKAKYNINNINYRIFDSANLSIIKNFANSRSLEILIINIDKFNKDTNKLNLPDEVDFQGNIPIESIQNVRPVLIIDEPQNFTTDKAKESINRLNPTFIARYSATHVEEFPCVYKLTPIDAYNKNLVKKIIVKAISPERDFNQPNIRLVEFTKAGLPKIELDYKRKDGSSSVKVYTPKSADIKNAVCLADETNNEKYREYKFKSEYSFDKDDGYIEFTNGERIEISNGQDRNNKILMQKSQIEETIKSHLDKELELYNKKIKVLTLFFIDQVANYGTNPSKRDGVFAMHFEESLGRLLQEKKYEKLLPQYKEIEEVHGGYFSQDKNNFKDTSGKTNEDGNMYELIMRDKEKLLDINTPLKFIFSHSTLREGWDNPNVFQICTLNNTGKDKDVKRRQEIGRGLRLAVNNSGEVVSQALSTNKYDVLTVITNESYTEFVKNLQSELDSDLNLHTYSVFIERIAKIIDSNGEKFGIEESQKFVSKLTENKLISIIGKDKKVKFTSLMKEKIKNDDFSYLEEYDTFRDNIISFIELEVPVLKIDNAYKKITPKINEKFVGSEMFKNLQEILSQKTKYHIEFDTNDLIKKIMEDFNIERYTNRLQFKVELGKIDINDHGKIDNDTTKVKEKTEDLYSTSSYEDIDIVSEIMASTNLTRSTIVELLKNDKVIKNNGYTLIKQDPQYFIKEFSALVKSTIREQYTRNGLVYTPINSTIDTNILFEAEAGYENDGFPKMIQAGDKSLFDYLKCDSSIEEKFLEYFKKREDIEFFFKIPKSFQIKTPVGKYSPDWLFVKKNENINFIIETKSTDNLKDLNIIEQVKIIAGENHFKVIELNDEVQFTDNPYASTSRLDIL